jgi:hypothetical protein
MMTESESQLFSQSVATQDDPDVLSIMISTDNHLVRLQTYKLHLGRAQKLGLIKSMRARRNTSESFARI